MALAARTVQNIPERLRREPMTVLQLASLNRACQPRLWSVESRAKFVTFAAPTFSNGFPDPRGTGAVLEKLELTPPYSIVVNLLTVSLDGGRTHTKILAGFAYKDTEPKLITSRNDGCVPA